MKLIVGIDLGTSTSVVRYKTEGSDTISTVKDADGKSELIPSVIFRPENPEIETLYGNLAISRHDGGEPGELITNFKMGLLDVDPDQRQKKMEQIEEFMKYLHQCFDMQVKGLHATDMDVYVSYPAKWPSDFVKFMKDTTKKAGFEGNIIGIPEPKAATYNALFNHLKDLTQSKMLAPGKQLNILLLDMGAGTSDIEIFKIRYNQSSITIDDVLSYPTIDNDALCGGREIDLALQQIITDHLANQLGMDKNMAKNIFPISEVKNWKDNYLSNKLKNGETVGMPSAVLKLLNLWPNGSKAAKSFDLNRHSFETFTRQHWAKLYGLLESAFDIYKQKYGGNGAADIDLVLLTGGHSAWYTVPRLFNGEGIAGSIGKASSVDGQMKMPLNFKKIVDEPWRVFQDPLPHESVANGLCRQDLGIDIPDSAVNNVYIKMKVNEKETDYINVIKMGQALPVEIKDQEIGFNFKSTQNHVYDLTIEVLTGQSIETAEHWVYRHHYDDRVGAAVATLLFVGLPLLFGFDYNFMLRYNLTAAIDGTISFKALVKKDTAQPVEIGF